MPLTATRMYLRAEARHRWPAWASVALLIAAFAGVVTAAAAGARRTDAAYPQLLAWSRAPDLLILSGFEPQMAPLPRAALARLPQVAAVGYTRQLSLAAPQGINLLAPEDNRIPGQVWGRKILAGRPANPGRAGEAEVSFAAAQDLRLRPGDRLTVVLRRRGGGTIRVALRVTGIEAAAAEFPPQIDAGPPDVWVTPAFWRAHRAEALSFPEAAVRLRPGTANLLAVERVLTGLAGHEQFAATDTLAAQAANTERSIHLQAVALWLLAGLLGVIGVLTVGQLLARLSVAEALGYGTLRALGLNRGQLLVIGLSRAAVLGTAAAGGAIVLAVALSPLLPVGLAALAEPHPGLDADGPVLALAAVATVVVTVAAAAPSAWRAARVHGPQAGGAGRREPLLSLAISGGSAPRIIGVQLALRPGSGPSALPVRSTIAGAVAGLAGLAAALTLTASLGHLLATPSLYGVTFDAVAGSANGAPLTAVTRLTTSDPDVAAWSEGFSDGVLQIGGRRVDVMALGGGRGQLPMATPLRGRLPRASHEITLGPRTLVLLHTRIGATVIATFPGGRPVRLRVVGSAVFPTFSDGLGLGQGAALSLAGVRALTGGQAGTQALPYDALVIRFRRGIEPAAAQARLADQLTPAGAYTLQGPPAPTDLVNFGRVRDLPLLLGVALSVLALLTITHLLITSARRRRRDFAVLRVLGCTSGQIRASAAWQAGTLTAVALAIGIPVGVLCGRLAWQAFAHYLGVLPVLAIPVSQLALVVAAAFLLVLAVATLPGQSAARTHPAQTLRTE
jgi:FtsX-like permease family